MISWITKKKVLSKQPELCFLPHISDYIKIEAVQGFSREKKYHLFRRDGREFLLLLDSITEYGKRRLEGDWFLYCENHSIPTNRLEEFGTCNNDRLVYCMLSWLPGRDVQSFLTLMDQKTHVELGIKAGRLLRLIHSLPMPAEPTPSVSLAEEIQAYLYRYSDDMDMLQRYPAIQIFLSFLDRHKDIKRNEQRCSRLHGDYHAKNLIISEDTSLSIIDWVCGAVGDPWEDFVRNVVSAETSPTFASAQIDSYFDNCIPENFWLVLAIYTAIQGLKITRYNFVDHSFAERQHQIVLEQYDMMNSIIPMYYKSNQSKGRNHNEH